MNNKQNRKLKFLWGALYIIIFGIIGSGIWDKLISPNIDIIIQWFISIYSNLSEGYMDSIYSKVGDGNKEQFSFMSYAIFSSIWVTFLLIGLFVFLFILPHHYRILFSKDE